MWHYQLNRQKSWIKFIILYFNYRTNFPLLTMNEMNFICIHKSPYIAFPVLYSSVVSDYVYCVFLKCIRKGSEEENMCVRFSNGRRRLASTRPFSMWPRCQPGSAPSLPPCVLPILCHSRKLPAIHRLWRIDIPFNGWIIAAHAKVVAAQDFTPSRRAGFPLSVLRSHILFTQTQTQDGAFVCISFPSDPSLCVFRIPMTGIWLFVGLQKRSPGWGLVDRPCWRVS